MPAGWQAGNLQPISNQLITQMYQMAFGSADYKNSTLLSNEHSHQNHLLTLNNDIQVILRIGHNKNNLQKQYALAQKLWRKLPVQRFISQVMQINDNQYFAFLEFKRGAPLVNLEKLPPADQAQLGFELGEYLALIHSQTFTTAGEFSSDLKVNTSYDMSPKGMAKLCTKFLDDATQHGHISTTQSRSYATKFEVKIQILSQWQHGNCLIHNNLNEKNILHNDGHVSAISEWQFTISGHPALDFAKFTRAPYINSPIFLENLCDSYYLTHKSLPAHWDDIASIVDLISSAKFLCRKNLSANAKINAIKTLNAGLGG